MLRLSLTAKIVLGVIVAAILAFMYVPLMLVVLNSFNAARIASWPVRGFSLESWGKAFTSEPVRAALLNSVLVATGATAIALVLGTLVAFALQRYDFFGKRAVNLLVVLPIALPGIVTGVALNNTYNQILEPIGIHVGFFGMIIAHGTFCIVMVFNNILARLRRLNPGVEEASKDLGATPWQTFRMVTFPQFRSAFIAGGILAFALSFDEVYVTIFTAPPGVDTLPLWIMNQMARPNEANVVNVVATVVILASFIPVWVSQRLGREIDERG
ncbi:putative spermidine/putrescine transport system permease protein [Microbacterium ginsengiterrae]|uniref:Putative spermidine/putrescine transport system permease protein n=1 Tax=Microbacterium ginsengiterrae TaxID=546115 RepID=A0A7W9CE75_9MICO|nr:ABC transporter permease [Microbacterium ginsengiterrae]MBB5743901.1 putative spermidine/putrescine transport system permease protein [Microbacterium ginsengiterrae]